MNDKSPPRNFAMKSDQPPFAHHMGMTVTLVSLDKVVA
jgi:hypothetical protein